MVKQNKKLSQNPAQPRKRDIMSKEDATFEAKVVQDELKELHEESNPEKVEEEKTMDKDDRALEAKVVQDELNELYEELIQAEPERETELLVNPMFLEIKLDFVSPFSLCENQKMADICSENLISELSEKLDEFECLPPLIVDSNGNVLVGNARLIAAKRMKLAFLPVYNLIDLTNDEKTAYVFSIGEFAATLNLSKKIFYVEVSELRLQGMVI